MPVLMVDWENSGEEFWREVSEAIVFGDIPPGGYGAVYDLYHGGEAQTSKTLADELLTWFATLPGWEGGPEHAPHPIIVREE